MLGGLGFRFIKIKGWAGPIRKHCLECIDIWYGASLGEAIQLCSNEVPRILNDHTPGA